MIQLYKNTQANKFQCLIIVALTAVYSFFLLVNALAEYIIIRNYNRVDYSIIN